MATVKPFKCIRPRQDLASRIAALPYDVYNRSEALEEVKKEPLSFLKIDRAETQFDDSVDTYDERVYQKAHSTLWSMVEEGLFEQDSQNCYYIYELTMAGRIQTGIVACSSIDDYENNIIKKHENTRADKEIDRINHVNICNAQTGPIFLAYRSNETINRVTEAVRETEPVYDFAADDGVRHTVWKIAEESRISMIADAFTAINEIYIADGHHRAASAVKVGKMRREANPDFKGNEEFNFFLSVLFPDDQLMIMPYNRVVRDLNGLAKDDFIARLETMFTVENMGKKAYAPEKKGCFGMFLDSEWYKLTADKQLLSDDPVDGLDVSILQNNVLAPLLGIGDPRTDKRIDFIGGIRGLSELEKRVQSDMKIAFSMYPTSIEELFAVSDANLLMPPKSTWFEPKLRSGLFIHALSE